MWMSVCFYFLFLDLRFFDMGNLGIKKCSYKFFDYDVLCVKVKKLVEKFDKDVIKFLRVEKEMDMVKVVYE